MVILVELSTQDSFWGSDIQLEQKGWSRLLALLAPGCAADGAECPCPHTGPWSHPSWWFPLQTPDSSSLKWENDTTLERDREY